MGQAGAKAFLPVGGKPMAVYALEVLSTLPDLAAITLVVAADHVDRAADMLAGHGPWQVPIAVTPGGAERQDSVAAGLRLVPPTADLVIVHDAARPFVSQSCVSACVEAAAACGAAIAAVPAQDTVKVVDEKGSVRETLDRRHLWLAQTPQVFRATLLRQAYEHAQRDGYVATDDAALVERIGGTVRVVPGESSNRKITNPEDLSWAEWHVRSLRREAEK
jgi:2-C-methyl-D-erythritol 4-phosphate cytidylyltransferase